MKLLPELPFSTTDCRVTDDFNLSRRVGSHDVGQAAPADSVCRSTKKEFEMAVKHVPTNEVHKGTKGGSTGCGFDTREHPDHWVSTSAKITCDKSGCKN